MDILRMLGEDVVMVMWNWWNMLCKYRYFLLIGSIDKRKFNFRRKNLLGDFWGGGED